MREREAQARVRAERALDLVADLRERRERGVVGPRFARGGAGGVPEVRRVAGVEREREPGLLEEGEEGGEDRSVDRQAEAPADAGLSEEELEAVVALGGAGAGLREEVGGVVEAAEAQVEPGAGVDGAVGALGVEGALHGEAAGVVVRVDLLAVAAGGEAEQRDALHAEVLHQAADHLRVPGRVVRAGEVHVRVAERQVRAVAVERGVRDARRRNFVRVEGDVHGGAEGGR